MSATDTRNGVEAGPALALLELCDVPRGLRALDALVKEADVAVLARGTVQCGRYLVAFAGQVEAVERSYARAVGVAEAAVGDQVLLPDAEPRIVPAFRDGVVRWPARGDALGVVQTASSPVLLAVVDAALKGADVDLVELRLADGLGGRAIATLWGEIHDVEAALEITERAVERHAERHGSGREGLSTVVVPNADEETMSAVSGGTRFFGEWRG
jgi:microcompartment protein CcmL/EutN